MNWEIHVTRNRAKQRMPQFSIRNVINVAEHVFFSFYKTMKC